MSNSTHRVNVVKIEEVLPHPNADTLGIVHIGGYQCVVKKDNYKAGDLAIYVQPDTIVPVHPAFEFLWTDIAANTITHYEPTERRRRITVRRFRKEWSEGLLMPLRDFHEFDFEEPSIGADVATLLGFTHYEEPEVIHGPPRTRIQYQHPWRSWGAFKHWVLYKLGFGTPLHGNNAKPPKNAPPTYDVEGFKNFPHVFEEGEQVIVTEKIHGSNARFLFDGDKMHVGSKNLWKSEKSTCIWRKALKELPWIEEWCRANPGYTLYGEVVPTQKGYAYGTGNVDELFPVRFFAFDVLCPSGEWMPKAVFVQLDISKAPVLYQGPFDLEYIKKLVEGPSTVSRADHIREGIVITSEKERQIRGLGRAQLKWKSMKFLEKETA